MNSAKACGSVLLLLALGTAVAAVPEGVLVLGSSEDEIPTAAAWSPDGQRLAYATERKKRRRGAPLSVGDKAFYYPSEVWVTDFTPKKKPKRLLKHDSLARRFRYYFNYRVDRLVWSPDGTRLAIEITDEDKETATFLITAKKGKSIKIGKGGRNFITNYGAAWLENSKSLGVLSEAVKPRLLHRVGLVRVKGGRGISLFRTHTFAAVAWLPHTGRVAAVERDKEFSRAPRLMVGNVANGTLEEIDEVENYLGGLQASPDETRVSYFVGQEKLAVRALAAEAPVEHWPVPLGRYQWARGREGIIYIEPKEIGGRTGWLTLYDAERGKSARVLEGELIQDFWVAPDGSRVAVLTAGLRPQLKIYPLSSPD